jgi:membrane protein DedA with SNARE-associated domain/rhodanese-related sulfurtransferase
MAVSSGLGIVFGNVLLEQLGVPIPAVPTLIVAGALAADGQLSGGAVGALAVGACVIGDAAWYTAGRLYGGRVMRLLCRISLTPDICVSQTQVSFERHGAKVLIVAKLVPGLGLITPPLAGATRMSYPRFALYSALGASLWVGAALLAGLLLRAQIVPLLPRLRELGELVAGVLLAVLAAYIAYKWRQRQRFRAAIEMARISVDELHGQMSGETNPVIVDVRSVTALSLAQQRIPGALHVPLQEVTQYLGSLPRDRDVILYCTCPNEASAAQAARLLMSQGFKRARPLRGGLDAWIAAGYAVEEVPVAESAAAAATVAPEPTR